MTETDLTRLYDELDVAWYLKNSCDYEMSPFIANGWNNSKLKYKSRFCVYNQWSDILSRGGDQHIFNIKVEDVR